MKNIFGNFQFVPNNEKGYILELERKHGINLPPLFRVFCQTFTLNSLAPDEHHHIIHPDENLGFEGFRKSLEERIIIYLNAGEYYQKDRMLPIITSGVHGGGICVSLDNDKIYVLNEMMDERFVEIAENIFDFIKQLEHIDFRIG